MKQQSGLIINGIMFNFLGGGKELSVSFLLDKYERLRYKEQLTIFH